MRVKTIRAVLAVAVLSVVAVGCSSNDSSSDETTAPVETDAPVETEAPVETDAPVETEAPEETDAPVETEAPEAVVVEAGFETGITVDGDAADWADVSALDLTLQPITDESAEARDAVLKVAHDGENVFVLVQVDDDYNWDPEDLHLSAAIAVAWSIDDAAGEAMGATDEDREASTGMVDIWHWELECAAGVISGGSTSGPGEGKDAGNDEACNFDDEWSTDTETREDDNGEGAENSLAGSWTHSDPVADAEGIWTFEMSRPMDTGDSADAVVTAGGTSQLGIAYWDVDSTPDGWEDSGHVQSTDVGWIIVNFAS